MLVECWPTVFDAGPTFNQHLFNVSCLLGCTIIIITVITSVNRCLFTNHDTLFAAKTVVFERECVHDSQQIWQLFDIKAARTELLSTHLKFWFLRAKQILRRVKISSVSLT